MKIETASIEIPKNIIIENNFKEIQKLLEISLKENFWLSKFVIVGENLTNYICEYDLLEGSGNLTLNSVFDFRRRSGERSEKFNAIMIVPTGIACSIGGHAGDATPASRLIATACDNLILHPNVVNASDINEQPDNSLYVEGSILSKLLMGTISLTKVRANRLLLVSEERIEAEWIVDNIINCANASMATLGIDFEKIIILKKPISMMTDVSKMGRAIGVLNNLDNLINAINLENGKFDAIAIASKIETHIDSVELHRNYFTSDSENPNPWGGIEATLTHFISSLYQKPSAHVPAINSPRIRQESYGIVDPRKAAEVFSSTYLYCALKGLYKSPKISEPINYFDPSVISAEDISCLITPYGAIGIPFIAALAQDIPIIAVIENRNIINCTYDAFIHAGKKIFLARNYLEAVGIMNAIKYGISLKSLSRPLIGIQVKYT